jgi:Holliday junction resolvase RusA-like endonuclease
MWSAELADYLDAIAVWNRGLRVRIKTAELLRQGGSRPGRARPQEMLREARQQLANQMRVQRRRRFRGDVSVELDIFASDEPEPPSAPKSVKRYLDALSGIVYADDSQVSHLSVIRFTGDHPIMRRRHARGSSTRRAGGGVRVDLTVLPVRLYVSDYDRFFRLGDDMVHRASSWDLDSDATAFFEDRWDATDDLRLDDLRDERREEEAGAGLSAWIDRELADRLREFRDRELAELEGKLLLDQRPTRGDRPGTPEAEIAAEMLARLGLPTLHDLSRYELPAHFWLPLPPESSGAPAWERTVRDEMAKHRTRWRLLPTVFDQPLALDISVQGAGANSRDVDNTAHAVLAAFEEVYCGERRGTVVRYRVYRRAGENPGVRVQVMTDERLRQLDAGIEAARAVVIRLGPRGVLDR